MSISRTLHDGADYGGELPIREVPSSAKPHVLFIEDRVDALRAFERLLKVDAERWTMTFVQTFAEGLACLDAGPVDVVVISLAPARFDHVIALEREHPATVRMVFGAPAVRENVVRITPLCHQYLVRPVDVLRLHERLCRALVVRDLIAKPSLRAVVGDTESLPSPPPVLIELRGALEQRRTDAAVIAKIVEQDPGLAAKILQLANSAFFGASRKYAAGSIVNVREAVVLLGVATIEQLALISGLFVALDEADAREVGFSTAELRRHSVLVGEVAANLGTSRRFADEAYAGGLLHDVGKLLLASRAPELYGRLMVEARQRRLPLWKLEQEHLGATHAEAGAYLLACWGLPPIVVEAVAHHHRPSALGRTHFDAVGAVHVAEVLVRELDALPGERAAGPETELDTAYLERTGAAGRLAAFRDIAKDIASRSA